MNTKFKKTTVMLPVFIFWGSAIFAQIQKGKDIDGEAVGDRSGFSVSMPDISTVAIGAPKNDGNGGNAGHVRVYTYSGADWVQKGADLDGEAAGDLFGSAVSMPDANTIAIGAPENDGTGTVAGHVRVFEWSAGAWVQKGIDIDGDVPTDAFGDIFGSAVSMPDANTLAVGAPWNNNNGFRAGQVKVLDWDGTKWVQRGTDIYGAAASYSGSVVCMPSIDVVAIASQGAASGAGQVNVFEWSGTSWVQKGGGISGEKSGDLSGNSISMPDANTIAIGASNNDGSGGDAGHVRVYQWDGAAWTQKGTDIDGEAEGDKSGNAVSMPDANTIAIGASLNDGNSSQSGHVRIYNWNGTEWIQLGMDIDGEATLDQSGYSVSMPDANTLAIGAIQNDGNGNESGHVRIYNLETTSIKDKTTFQSGMKVHPNPTNGICTIVMEDKISEVHLAVKNMMGQEVFRNDYTATHHIDVNMMDVPAGIYFIELVSESKKAVFKLVKE